MAAAEEEEEEADSNKRKHFRILLTKCHSTEKSQIVHSIVYCTFDTVFVSILRFLRCVSTPDSCLKGTGGLHFSLFRDSIKTCPHGSASGCIEEETADTVMPTIACVDSRPTCYSFRCRFEFAISIVLASQILSPTLRSSIADM